VDHRGGGAADAGGGQPAPRHPALADPAPAQHDPAAVGDLPASLARFDPLNSITGPQADVAPPNAKIAHDPEVAAAAEGVVRVLGTACGLGVEGSGWIAARDTVVTNAHVVAGRATRPCSSAVLVRRGRRT